MTDEKIKELLGILDMPEEEQCKYFWKNAFKLSQFGKRFRDCVRGDFWVGGAREDVISGKELRLDQARLADLAFRLRDEAVKNHWVEWLKAKDMVMPSVLSCGYDNYFANEALPIHFVIASLIAKELANEKKKK